MAAGADTVPEMEDGGEKIVRNMCAHLVQRGGDPATVVEMAMCVRLRVLWFVFGFWSLVTGSEPASGRCPGPSRERGRGCMEPAGSKQELQATRRPSHGRSAARGGDGFVKNVCAHLTQPCGSPATFSEIAVCETLTLLQRVFGFSGLC